MREIQIDLLDIQARESLATMIQHVEFIKDKTLEKFEIKDPEMSQKVDQAISILKEWNFEMRGESAAAAIFHLWEHNIYNNLHSFKIRSPRTRMAMPAVHTYDDFVYKQIHSWTDHKEASNKEFCI
jgi:acyl-homoserine lactone acylase PvdQ